MRDGGGERAARGDRPRWQAAAQFPLVSLLIAVAALAAVFGAFGLVFGAVFGGLSPSVAQVFGGVLTAMAAVAFGKLVLARIGPARHDEFPLAGAIRQIALGLLGAFVLMSAIVGIVALLGGYRIAGPGGGTSWPSLIFGAGLGAGFFEELVFRGVLFRFLEEFGGSWFALALTSAVFGAGHLFNPNASLLGAIGIAVSAGVLLGGAYMAVRSLWLPAALHAGWNITQGLVWDVPVSGNPVDGLVAAQPAGPVAISGGTFGLEASVVTMVVAGAAGAWLTVLAARRGAVVRPWWIRRRSMREDNPT